jgi:hypothetical protein
VKRIALLGAVLLVFALAVATISPAWYSNSGDESRETVELSAGTADIDVQYTTAGFSGTDESDTELPMKAEDFNQTESMISFYSFGDPTNMSFSVNGVAIATDVELANNTWLNKTFADLISAGVDGNATTFTGNGTFNNSDWELTVYFVADGAPLVLSSAFDVVYMQEDYNSSIPMVEHHWEVRDSINITAICNMTNVNLTLSYPDDGEGGPWGSPTTSWLVLPTLTESVYNVSYVIWEKEGPSVDYEDEDAIDPASVTLANKILTVTFESYDYLEDATWDLDDGDIYDDYLSDITEDDDMDLEISLNDRDVDDIEIQDDTIILTELPDIDVGENEIVFQWYDESAPGEAPTTPVEEEPTGFLYDEAVEGVPNWALLLIAIVIIIAIIAVMKIEKK